MELQALYGEDVREHMARLGINMSSLADEIDVKSTTLRGYLDGTNPLPMGLPATIARILGRNIAADYVTLGLLDSPMAGQYLRQHQRLRTAAVIQNTALLAAREPLAESPGAQLAATLMRSPDPTVLDIDIRLRLIVRGLEHPMPFAELLILDLPPAAAQSNNAVRSKLVDLPVVLPGRASATFGDALDQSGAVIESGLDYLSRLRRQYRASDTAVMIIVPRLLATRPHTPFRQDPSFDHLESVAITSLYFGGSPDVAALVADQARWGYASAGLLTHQLVGTASTRHGGQGATSDPQAESSFRLACQDITESLLDPTVTGRQWVTSLDEPEDALAVLRRLVHSRGGEGPADARSPLVMLRISSRRLKWVANREVVNTRSGAWNDDSVVAAHRQLLRLQDELTRAVEAVPGRPTVVLDVPESAVDYDDSEKDTTDEDFDTYVTVSSRVREWLTSLRDSGTAAG
jgi:hypothetical protein